MPALNDWGKLVLLLTIVLASALLAGVGRISGEAALGVFLYVGGYVTGNGVLARKRQAPSTLLAPKLELPDDLEPGGANP